MKKMSLLLALVIALLGLPFVSMAQENLNIIDPDIEYENYTVFVNVQSISLRARNGSCLGYALRNEVLTPVFRTNGTDPRDLWLLLMPEAEISQDPFDTPPLEFWFYTGNVGKEGLEMWENLLELPVYQVTIQLGQRAPQVVPLEDIPSSEDCRGAQQAQPEIAPTAVAVETPAPQTVSNGGGGNGNGSGGNGGGNNGSTPMCQYHTSWYHGTADDPNDPNDDHAVDAWLPLGQAPDWPLSNYNAKTTYGAEPCSNFNNGQTYSNN